MIALLAAGPAVLAHGGLGGAVVEVVLTVGILAVFAAVWIRERRARATDGRSDDA